MIKQTWTALAAAICCFASSAEAASPVEQQVATKRVLSNDSEQAQWGDLRFTRKLHASGAVVGSLTASTEAAGVPPAAMTEALQALATAGFTQFANTKNIYVLRTHNGKQQKMPFNYRQAMKGDTVAQNINLKPGDTIVVP